MPVPEKHFVNGEPLVGPWPGKEQALFGMGCFWGAERLFWQLPGVTHGRRLRGRLHARTRRTGRSAPAAPATPRWCWSCSTPEDELRGAAPRFWENHDPTQGMRQGNDAGTQYRSAIYTFNEAQRRAAEASREAYQKVLSVSGHGRISTEIREAPEFFYAEDYHQQYLGKNPGGYCGLEGTGVSCPVGLETRAP